MKMNFLRKLRKEIEKKSSTLFEKSIDSQIKLKKFMDEEKRFIMIWIKKVWII